MTLTIQPTRCRTGYRANPFSSFQFHCDDNVATTVRKRSNFMGGFNHSFIRDVETGEITVFGRNRTRILNAIEVHFGVRPKNVKISRSTEFWRERG